jgi:hypothetical protein
LVEGKGPGQDHRDAKSAFAGGVGFERIVEICGKDENTFRQERKMGHSKLERGRSGGHPPRKSNILALSRRMVVELILFAVSFDSMAPSIEVEVRAAK